MAPIFGLQMKALEILNNLIESIFVSDRWKPKYNDTNKPGAMIQSLSEEKREELKKLTSEELLKDRVPDPAYWCDDYYTDKGNDRNLREAKLKFDIKLKK
jgi:hypothetical protein